MKEFLTIFKLKKHVARNTKHVFSLFTIIFSLFIIHCSLFTVNAQWIQTSGPTGFLGDQVNCLAVKGDTIFAGTLGGLYLSANNGVSWDSLEPGSILSIAINGVNIFTSPMDGGVFLSTNNGASWSLVGLSDYGVSSFAIRGTNIFAGTGGGVFLSTNNGSSWTAINNGLSDSIDVGTLAISGKNIFAGTGGGISGEGVFLSTNNGASWNSAGLQNHHVSALAVGGVNIYAGADGGVFLSTNNGTNWSAINNGLPDEVYNPIQSFTISGTNIFAGTGGGAGVFLSTDNGGNWTNIGLLNLEIPGLVVSGDTIFAGTINKGVWKRALSDFGIGINELKNNNETLQFKIYPNPVIQQTTISYLLSAKLFVNIRIYDITGKEVATIIDKIQDKGEHKINFHAETLNNGFYFVNCFTNNGMRVVKFVKE